MFDVNMNVRPTSWLYAGIVPCKMGPKELKNQEGLENWGFETEKNYWVQFFKVQISTTDHKIYKWRNKGKVTNI